MTSAKLVETSVTTTDNIPLWLLSLGRSDCRPRCLPCYLPASCFTCLPCLPANLLHTLALILPAYLIIYLPTNLYVFLYPTIYLTNRGSKEVVVLRQWESRTGNLVLTTELKTLIGHRKKFKG